MMLTVNVSKQQLESLYVGQGLTIRQCAEVLGLPTSGGISWRLRKYGIAARPQLQVDKFHGGAKPREKHKVTVHCAYCGRKLERYPSLIQERNFCNFACKGEWQRKEILGQCFGMLTVTEPAGKDGHNHLLWKCACECGGEKVVNSSALLGGLVKSCGCQRHPKGELNHKWKGGKCIEVKCANPGCGNTKLVFPGHKKAYGYFFCSETCKGEYRSKLIRGENHPKWKPRIETACAYCGESLTITATRNRLYAKSFCNVACQGKWISENKVADNNPNWRGGKSFEPYPITWNFRLREAIRNRDGRMCQVCGKAENGERLAIHHIDYDKKNIVPENLVALCHTCHCKTNSNREGWREFFSLLMEFPDRQQIAV